MTDPTEITGVEDTGMIATDPPTEPEQPASMIVAKAADQWLHPLEPYGPAKALREMTRRIMLFDTGKIRMNPTEAAHLAQVSASAWLNPFTGEIWGWVTEYQSRGRTQRKLSIMPGRKGLIRHAKEQSIAEGDKFWPEYEPVVATQLRADYRLDTGDLGFICKLRSVREIEVWNQSLVAAGTAGLEPSDVKNLVGTRPFTFGLGILRAAEIATLDRRSDNRMTHTERAQKRAYMMSLKQKYVLPLAHAIGEIGQTVDDYLVEGEFTELEPPEPEELTAEQVKELADKAKETPVVDLEVEDRGSAEPEPEPESDRPLEVEGDTSAPRPYSPGLIRDRYKKATERFAGTRKTEKVGGMELWQMVAWQLRDIFLGDDNQETKYHAALEALTGKSSSKELTGAECRAILLWLDPKEREGPGAGLQASKMAKKEAEQLWQEALLAKERSDP